MLNLAYLNSRKISIIIKLLPILSFAIPLFTLYYLYPSSFEETWKGRTYYLFFIWLVLLETILSWEELGTTRISKIWSKRTIGLIMFLLLPTFYVIITNFLGLISAIEQWYKQYMGSRLSVEEINWFAPLMPLSLEYFIYATIFLIINIIIYGKRRLTTFSISTSLLFVIGTFYIIDNLFPYGQIMLLQIPALPTTHLAANILNLMGYQTTISFITNAHYGWMPYLSALDPKNPYLHFESGIGWVCAGVESILLYTITILLFLKKSNISLEQKVAYFIFGAVVTYFINILRIVTIFVIAMNQGDWGRFHDFYGPLYSVTWIISYPLIMIGSQTLWRKIKN
jgi:exosortase/archaeosortase family protein